MKTAEQICEDISALFGDTSVSREDTLDALETIREHANQFIETIEADMADEPDEDEGNPDD